MKNLIKSKDEFTSITNQKVHPSRISQLPEL